MEDAKPAPLAPTPTRNPGRGWVATLAATLLFAGAGAHADEPKEPPAAARRYAVAVGFQTRHLFQPAADEWRKFLAEFPDDRRCDKARHHLGVCLLEDGQLDEAVAEFNKVIAASPRYPQIDAVTLNLGVAYYTRARKSPKPGDDEAALRAFATVLQKFPQSPQAPRALFYQAETYEQGGKRAEAADAYGRLIGTFPLSDLAPDATLALGVVQDSLEKPEQAAATFAGFLQKYPNHPLADECRLRQGEVCFGLKNYEEAEPLFAKVAESAGFSHADHALLRQAACEQERGRSAQAAALYQTLPRKFPKSPLASGALLSAGKCLFLAGKYPPARQVLEPLTTRKAPESAEAAYWTARCRIEEKAPASALPVLDAALAANPPESVRPLLQIARADALRELPDRRAEAAALYAEIVRTHPDHPQAPRALYMAAFSALEVGRLDAARDHAAAFAAKYTGHELAPEAQFVAAEADLRAKRYGEAAARYRDLISQHQTSPRVEEAKVRRGLALALQKQDEQAIAALTPELPGIKDKALLAEAHDVIGRAHADLKRYEPAVASFEAALTAKPDWPRADETLLAMAHAYRALGKPDDAAGRLRRLIDSAPKSIVLDQAYEQLAACEYERGKLDEALAHFRDAVKKAGDGPVAPLALLGIGRTLYRKGDAPGAIAAVDQLAARFPGSDVVPRSRQLRALAEHRRKQYPRAIEDAQAYLGTNPEGDDALDARLLIGLCQAALGRHAPAAESFASIVKANPAYPQADQVYYEMAFSLMALKRDAEAADAFRKVADTAPSGPLAAEGLFRSGEAQFGAGKFAEAAEAYRQAQAKTTDPALKEKSLHKLGWCAWKRSEWDAAATLFDRQAADFPGGPLRPDALFLAAECQYKSDHPQPAYDRFLQVIQAKPPAYLARALYRAGQCAGLLKNWTASAGHYGELIAAFPKFEQKAEAHYGLGWALQNQEQYSQAIDAYKLVTAESDAETAAKAQFMIGECYFATKEHAEAARQFLKGAFGYPYEEWVGNSHFEAARCFEVLKQVAQARQSYQVLVAQHPNHPKAKAAAERLKELGE